MKKSNLFSFFARGATATHPLCSVFTITLLFVFCSVCVSVSADTSPSNLPYSDSWQFSQALEAYNSLTPDQKQISDFLVGCQGNSFAGLSNYNLKAAYDTFDNAVSGVSKFGQKIWNNMKEAYNKGYEIGSGIRNKLSNFLGSTVEYAAGINLGFSAWLGNVGISANSSAEFRIGYYPETTKDYLNYFGDQKLYDWQFSSAYLDPRDFPVFQMQNSSPNGNVWQDYNNAIGLLDTPLVRSITYTNNDYGVFSSPDLATYHNIFVNLSNNSVYVCDDYGNMVPSRLLGTFVGIIFSGAQVYQSGNAIDFHTINYSNYNNLVALYDALYNDPNLIVSFAGYSDQYLSLCDFIQNLYIGTSWDNKVYWSLDFDLNFAPVSNYVTVYSPHEPIYIDIVGFINDLYDNDKPIKDSVEDNSVVSTGTPVPPDIWDTISNYFTRPESGIHIGTDFFKLPGAEFSIFDTYIADLWRNTKDFVLFCGDVLNIFTAEGGGGLAYVVYGGIAVGVIGGIFSKFLL